MRLSELEPRWLTPNLFIFDCPHCVGIITDKKARLTCKNVVMPFNEQYYLFEKLYGEGWNHLIVGCKDDMAWGFSTTDFETITVTPSLDASASGHWHGNIQNGNIV